MVCKYPHHWLQDSLKRNHTKYRLCKWSGDCEWTSCRMCLFCTELFWEYGRALWGQNFNYRLWRRHTGYCTLWRNKKRDVGWCKGNRKSRSRLEYTGQSRPGGNGFYGRNRQNGAEREGTWGSRIYIRPKVQPVCPVHWTGADGPCGWYQT